MAKKNKLLTFIVPLLEYTYGPEQAARIRTNAEVRYLTLRQENQDEPPALRKHTEDLYPAIGLFEAQLTEGISRENAARFLVDALAERAEQSTVQMRKLMRIPGAPAIYPAAFKFVARTGFGPKAGFRFHFYHVGWKRVKFDMLRCPYCEIAKRYGCPEIVTAFCHTDDVNNASLHPRLHWNRTKTLGSGDDCCDFDLTCD